VDIADLIPRSGYYCAARLLSSGGFSHNFFDTPDALKTYIINMDAAGHTMYVAQATFDKVKVQSAIADNAALPKGSPKSDFKGRRTQDNATLLRSFFLDIDCGQEKFDKTPTKAYRSQAEAAKDLKRFCDETKLPFPTLVNSGNGLYAHWVLVDDVDTSRWRVVAQTLRNVCQAYELRIDPPRTCDTASVLRPVGTTNRKNGSVKPVRVLHKAPPVSLVEMAELLTAAGKKKKLKLEHHLLPAKYEGLLNEFTAGIEGPPSSLLLVAERCPQVRAVRDSQGDVDEPLWYGFIGMARYTIEGMERQLIHEWSQGHDDYSVEATERKIEQHIASGVGPTTCTKFAADNPSGCIACPHNGKIKSPITLGRPEPESIEIPEEQQPPPMGFTRSHDGIYHTESEGEQPQRVYDYDLYPVRLAFDQSLGYETVTFRHNSFRSREYTEFTVRASTINDQKQFLITLHDNHVQIVGASRKKHMMSYLDSYMAELRARRDLASLCTQMGWREKNGEKLFVCGETILQKGKDPQTAGFARNIPQVARSFTQKGDLQKWVAATQYLDTPGMEPFAFAFLAGAFGSPLLHFTGFAGAMVAMIGSSGAGKTLIGEWALSAYGDSTQLKLQEADTRNSLVARLGIYGSMPAYLDELSNIEPQDLSDILYRVTQGRDKVRLQRTGVERDVLNHWQLIAVASSNHSLVDKLAILKSNASAEINRILEVYTHPVDTFLQNATPIYRIFSENHGVAGPRYLQYLVDKQDGHRAAMDKIVNDLNKRTKAKSDERYWSAVAGASIYGGLIAKQLGLIKFDVKRIYEWLSSTITESRSVKQDLTASGVDLIGQFLDDRIMNALFTSGNEGKQLVSILREPRGAIEYRIDIDTHRLYIDRTKLRAWLNKNYGSYSDLKDELTQKRALVSTDTRKVLGGNTYLGGTQVPCWVIDLKTPVLGRQIMGIVKRETENLKEAAQ